jgi:hypothetical protein
VGLRRLWLPRIYLLKGFEDLWAEKLHGISGLAFGQARRITFQLCCLKGCASRARQVPYLQSGSRPERFEPANSRMRALGELQRVVEPSCAFRVVQTRPRTNTKKQREASGNCSLWNNRNQQSEQPLPGASSLDARLYGRRIMVVPSKAFPIADNADSCHLSLIQRQTDAVRTALW